MSTGTSLIRCRKISQKNSCKKYRFKLKIVIFHVISGFATLIIIMKNQVLLYRIFIWILMDPETIPNRLIRFGLRFRSLKRVLFGFRFGLATLNGSWIQWFTNCSVLYSTYARISNCWGALIDNRKSWTKMIILLPDIIQLGICFNY